MAQFSSERARAVVHWLMGQTGKKQEQIGRELGFEKKTSFSAVLNGKAAVPQRLPFDLAELDPRINLDYLTSMSARVSLMIVAERSLIMANICIVHIPEKPYICNTPTA